MAAERAIVVGAGIGGLACAIDLARLGFEVTVVERALQAGGKMREIAVGGTPVDAGPTVFTMRWVFDALFDDAGSSLDDHLALAPATTLARHVWSPDERLDLFADRRRTAAAIAAFAGWDEAQGYLSFCRRAGRIYETLEQSFLTVQKTGPLGLARSIGLDHFADLMAIQPFQSLWRALGDHFHDPRLRQLFARYATYCGSSPFAAPATLMLIAHVEQEGVWLIKGGMQRLADALARLAASLGVAFRYGAHVHGISAKNGRARGVCLDGGERLEADWIVLNADPAAVASGAFGKRTARQMMGGVGMERSLSAVTWAMQARVGGFPLQRHNIFFSADYAAEFREIFGEGRLPANPTVYVCAQDRSEAAPAPSGAERLLILINAPANGDQRPMSSEEIATCDTKVFDHLAKSGLALTSVDSAITTPAGFNLLFPATGGALYGPATHGWAAAFRRSGARTRTPGLYMAGGGAHPGAGAPMAALSGRLAAQQIAADRASTRRSRRGGMSGGTSTRSARIGVMA